MYTMITRKHVSLKPRLPTLPTQRLTALGSF